MIERTDSFTSTQYSSDFSTSGYASDTSSLDSAIDDDGAIQDDMTDSFPTSQNFVSRATAQPATTPTTDGTAPAPNEKPATTPEAPAEPGQQTATEQEKAKKGDTTDVPDPTEKAPPGMSAADIAKLNGGLLGSLGDQHVIKRDADGKEVDMGTMRDVLANDPNVKGVDKDGNPNPKADLANDPDAAWRAYRVLTAVKNETNKDGSTKPESVRHNGNVGGFTKSGDAAGGSEAGSLQDYLAYGRTPAQIENQKDPHAGKNGGSASGIETFGNTLKYGFEKFGEILKQGFEDFGKAIVKLGKDIGNAFKHFGQMVKNGLDGVGAAIRGDDAAKDKAWAKARGDASALGDDIKDGVKQVGKLAETLVPLALNFIPGVGTLASIGMLAVKTGIQVGLKVAEMATSAAAKMGLKAGVEAAGEKIVQELPKAAIKAGGKGLVKEAGQDYYTDTTGATPSETAHDIV